VRATNDVGLTDPAPATQTWTVDLSTPPVAALALSPNPVLTGDQVTLNASASHDPLDGTIVDYSWDLGSGSFTRDTGTSPTTTATYSSVGHLPVRVKVTNEVGGRAIAAATVDVRPTPPPGPVGVSINDGDYATTNPNVQLDVTWPAYSSETLISNDGGFGAVGGTKTVSLTSTIPWTLFSAGSERLPKIVYLRFPDSASPTLTFTDDIILDTTTPVIQGATMADTGTRTLSAYLGNKTFNVKVRATQKRSGISAARFSSRRSGGKMVVLRDRRVRGIVSLSRTIHVKTGQRPRWVRVRSAAGKWSSWHHIN
jgi:hypothetical protein